jgi:hypothetical protein
VSQLHQILAPPSEALFVPPHIVLDTPTKHKARRAAPRSVLISLRYCAAIHCCAQGSLSLQLWLPGNILLVIVQSALSY